MNLRKLNVAAAQINPALMKKEENLCKIVRFIEEATSKKNAKLIVFPECSLTGYVLNFNEIKEVAEFIPGESTEKIEEICNQLNVWVIVGLIEKTSKSYYNTAVLIGPEGIKGKYRKTHLPYQGVDRFISKGDNFIEPIDTPIGRFGLAICYDIFFPETARVLTLMNTELLVVLTNWAEGVEFYVNYLIQTRAIENHVNLIAVNRVGEERGFKFYGKSMIIDCFGKVLAKANKNEEIIAAEVDLNEAYNKHIIRIPGVWEVNCIKDRRPELYKVICEI
ncbi:MAG: carbon-nitrogen hydrolase family protein [Candidatus Bathyarchaeia archaeon]